MRAAIALLLVLFAAPARADRDVTLGASFHANVKFTQQHSALLQVALPLGSSFRLRFGAAVPVLGTTPALLGNLIASARQQPATYTAVAFDLYGQAGLDWVVRSGDALLFGEPATAQLFLGAQAFGGPTSVQLAPEQADRSATYGSTGVRAGFGLEAGTTITRGSLLLRFSVARLAYSGATSTINGCTHEQLSATAGGACDMDAFSGPGDAAIAMNMLRDQPADPDWFGLWLVQASAGIVF